jgi:hypothetical protein
MAPTSERPLQPAGERPLRPAGERPLRPAADGTLLQLRIVPRAGRNGLDGIVDGRLRVRLAAAPVDGAANAALIALMAERLALPRSAIRLLRGATSRHKTLLIEGLTVDQVGQRLGLAPCQGPASHRSATPTGQN